MKKNLAVAAAVVVIVAGGAYVYARHRAAQALEDGIAGVRAALPAGATLAYASAEPDVLARSGHLTGVTLTAPDVTYTAATLDVSPEGPGLLRRIAATGITARTPSGTASVDAMEVGGLTLPLRAGTQTVDLAAVRADHGVLTRLHATTGNGGALNVARASLDGYGPGRASTIDADGFDAAMSGTIVDHLAVTRLHLRVLLLADVIARASDGSGAWPHSLDYELSVDGTEVGTAGRKLVTMAGFTSGSDPKGGDRFDTHIDVADLVVMGDPALTPVLAQLGYERLQAGLHMHALVDRAAGQLRMDRLDVAVPAAADLHLALGLDNIPFTALDEAGADGSAAFSGMEAARMQGASLVYEDHSLAGRVLDRASRQTGQTVQTLKALAQAQLASAGQQLRLPPDVLGPVSRFLNDPHRLSVTLNPPTPIGAGDLQRVGADPQRVLGLTVTD